VSQVVISAVACIDIYNNENYYRINTGNWKVLVMDQRATRCISSVLTMYDIMERRVTLVEKLMLNRQPFPEMDVVYLVHPNSESIDRISADFKDRKTARYGDVHLFFIDTVRI
jgi:hypothetical protein